MKNKYFFILGGFSLLTFSCSSFTLLPEKKENEQSEKEITLIEVPQKIKNQFQKLYPNVEPTFYLEHHVEGIFYEAEFKNNEKKVVVTFYPDGNLLEVEKEMDLVDLDPTLEKQIRLNLNNKLKNYEILDIYLLEEYKKVVEKKIQIRMRSPESKSGFFISYFNQNGTLLKIEDLKLRSIITLN